MQTDMIMPHDVKTERAVIAAIIRQPELIEVAQASGLESEAFYNPAFRTLWQAASQMHSQDNPIDMVTLCNYLQMQGKLDNIGGEVFIVELFNAIATTARFDSWVNIAVKLTAKRKLIISCNETLNKCYKDSEPIKELLAEHSSKVAEISGMTQQGRRTTQAILQATDKMFSEGINGSQLVRYCIPAVDQSIIHARQQMHVLAAQPGTGKTAFALSAIAEQIRSGLVCALFCKESSSEELLGKLISIYSGIPYIRLLTQGDKLEPAERQAYSRARELVNKFQGNLFISGGGDYKHSIEGICGAMRRIYDERGQIDAAYVDYLQNMNASQHLQRKDKTPQVEYNIEALKDTFIDFDCAGTVLSQINRTGAQAGGKPAMHHLKYASAIEAEAHIITFLYRDKINDPAKSELETMWYSEKTRLFAPFCRGLIFKKDTAQYYGRYGTIDRP